MELLDSSRRVIDASETFAAARPLRASREFQRVSSWLDQAAAQLDRAVRGLRDTVDDAARSPQQAAEVPGRLIDATARWIDSAARMAELSDRLDRASILLVDSMRRGAISMDRSELTEDSGKAVIAPFLIPSRPVQRTSSAGRGMIRCLFARHASIPPKPAEAARKIVRGRAPPHANSAL